MLFTTPRLRIAETTSSIGAGVLGLGLGTVFSWFLNSAGYALLALELAMDAWGMYDMRRLETGAQVSRPVWSLALYWICWLSLVALGVYLLSGSL